jgi:hypothetical protein
MCNGGASRLDTPGAGLVATSSDAADFLGMNA